MLFEKYSEDDYEAVCDFFIELNRADRSHINWNWARFEWMYEHTMLNRARCMGANKAYVISDMDFYAKLGFVKKYHYTFYRRG